MNALATLPDVAPMDQETRLAKEYHAREMARCFNAQLEVITSAYRRMVEATKVIKATFNEPGGREPYVDIDLKLNSHTYSPRHDDERWEKELRQELERECWGAIVNNLGLKNIMSVAKRKQFQEQLDKGELPPINEETIIQLIFGLVEQAESFAAEAAKEVFDILRPRGPMSSQYKTNDAFRVGRRVILTGAVESGWSAGKFRTSHWKEAQLTAIDGIFHLLDGKGIMRENRGPLVQAITDCTGHGETTYFRFKCFKNRNLHLEFKRLDLVQELNMQAVGERVLGEDT